jgi:hypothetical protein
MKAKFTKTQSAQPVGAYNPTLIDNAKNDAQILLLQVAPKIVDSRLPLKGRGVKPFGSAEGRYLVTDKAWDCLKEQYTWSSDF